MFGMKGIYISASGAIQGHHGPIAYEFLLHVHIVQEAPIHQSHVYGWIKILQTIFEKGHTSNIPVKLFQNLTSSFGEDFLRISSSYPYSARSPHSTEPCLWTDQNFVNSI